jgi:hypothetical protein
MANRRKAVGGRAGVSRTAGKRAAAKRAAGKKAAAARSGTAGRGRVNYWSGEVTEHSHAMDLAPGVFQRRDPRSIARSLKRSAESSHNLKGTPFRSAMSMLNFYINRAGRGLDAAQRQRLQDAKSELRALYGRVRR